MSTSVSAARAGKIFRKSVTFTVGAGTGSVGTVAIATVTGTVQIDSISCHSTLTPVGATATIELGVATNTAALLAQIVATTLSTGKNWGTSAANVIVVAVTTCVVTGNIILTVGTANLTGGTLDFTFYYKPHSADGYLA